VGNVLGAPYVSPNPPSMSHLELRIKEMAIHSFVRSSSHE
jgi:hypothetical protein